MGPASISAKGAFTECQHAWHSAEGALVHTLFQRWRPCHRDLVFAMHISGALETAE